MSEIERYLDELFDQLAGTGAAGRRALAEAEDHLRLAAADAEGAGLPACRAEQEAVTRFGSPAVVARKLRWAHGDGLRNRALSAGWLLAGLALAWAGVAFLTEAGRLGWSAPECTVVLSSSRYLTGARLVHATTCAAAAAAAGALLLLSARYAPCLPRR